jgi:LysM repeat protein
MIMSFRRMLPFLLINVVVSAVTMLAILFWWENRDASAPEETVETAVTPTLTLATPNASNPTATPELEPEDEPLIHVVRAGDTLGNISEFYDVPLDDLTTANNINVNDFLSVGQQLVIPIGGLPTATPPPTETPIANILPSPIPTEELAAGGEVNVAITAVTGAGDLATEAVQITNLGGSQIALLGWELSDTGGHTFTFGKSTLFGDGAAIQIHTETGENGPADQYWGLETAVWETGEQVTLRDADGAVQATFTVP